jgi:hypothetical protein
MEGDVTGGDVFSKFPLLLTPPGSFRNSRIRAVIRRDGIKVSI